MLILEDGTLHAESWGLPSCSVACGFAHSMVVIDKTNVEDRLDQVILLLQLMFSPICVILIMSINLY